MMHKWESTEKLLPQWESQPIGQKKFDYEDFTYKQDEFDNVPPVVPRFLFYLQLNMKPVTDYCLELKNGQSVPQLRIEVHSWIEDIKNLMKASEERSQQRDNDLEAKCLDLQEQITLMRQQQTQRDEDQKKAAEQTLWDDDSFKFNIKKYGDQLERNNAASYQKNIDSEHFKKPRMFSLQQLRNSFYALMHESSPKLVIETLQEKTKVLINETAALAEMDKKLQSNITSNYDTQLKDLGELREEFTMTQRLNEKNHGALNAKVQGCDQKLSNHQDRLEDQKRTVTAMQNDQNKLGNKVESLKKDISESIQNTKDEMYQKIDANDAFCVSNFELIKEHSNKDRNVFQNAMTALRDELSGEMHKETDTLQKYVLDITKKSSAHRETLQEKYDEKIERIKDVCASYFSKYEKHLLQQQDLMKTLEQRQEDWINTLLKPQELNQARLYAIDSRLNEADKARMEDNQFNKDTLKKFIFAIEQHLSSSSQAGSVGGGLTQTSSPPHTAMGARANSATRYPPRSQRNVQTCLGGTRTGLTAPLNAQSRKSVADANFNIPSAQLNAGNGQMVPYVESTGTLLPTLPPVDSKKIGSQESQQPLSYVDLRGQSNADTATGTTSGLTTHDVLFLKRLLFLKATLDNQHQ